MSANHSGVKRASAGDDVQTLDFGNIRHFLGENPPCSVFQAWQDGVGKHLGLLVDLLEHEVVVTGLLGSGNVPSRGKDFFLYGISVLSENLD